MYKCTKVKIQIQFTLSLFIVCSASWFRLPMTEISLLTCKGFFLEITNRLYFDSNYISVSYIHQSFSQVVVCIEERLPSFVNQIDVPKLLTETCN